MVSKITYEYAYNPEELIQKIAEKTNQGDKIVIKPHGAGLGTGIEFFLSPEPLTSLRQKVSQSIEATQQRYGISDGAFPYTICDFFDSALIQKPGHPLHGHKYELRIMIYRSEDTLKAFPVHAKVSPKAYDPRINDHGMLMTSHVGGTDPKLSAMLRLPLTSPDTLELLKLYPEDLTEMCRFSTHFIHHVMAQFDENPSCFDNFSSLTRVT